MRCIKILTDEDFGLKSVQFNNPRIRFGARGLVFNDENKIAILNKKIKNEFKLVGGGIDDEEEPIEAFKREVLEETGCQIEIIKCIGTIEEHKSLDNFKQISYIYVAKVVKNLGEQNLTEKEIGEGSVLKWLDIDEAMDLIKKSENKLIASKYDGEKSIYHTKFIVRRDYIILNYFKNNELM